MTDGATADGRQPECTDAPGSQNAPERVLEPRRAAKAVQAVVPFSQTPHEPEKDLQRESAWRERVYSGSEGSGKRRRPPRTAIETCFWCGLAIGSVVYRGARAIVLRPEWDHAVPFAYLQASPQSNWVPSCHVCNALKGSRIFDTLDEARAYLRSRREAKGYRGDAFPTMVSPPDASQEAVTPWDAPPMPDVRASTRPTNAEMRQIVPLIDAGLDAATIADRLSIRLRTAERAINRARWWRTVHARRLLPWEVLP